MRSRRSYRSVWWNACLQQVRHKLLAVFTPGEEMQQRGSIVHASDKRIPEARDSCLRIHTAHTREKGPRSVPVAARTHMMEATISSNSESDTISHGTNACSCGCGIEAE